MIPTPNEKDSEVMVTEGTIVDKKVTTRYISTGRSVVPVEEHKIVADIAGGQYEIQTTATTYNSVNKGDNMMFKVYYRDEKVNSITLAESKDLVSEVSTE